MSDHGNALLPPSTTATSAAGQPPPASVPRPRRARAWVLRGLMWLGVLVWSLILLIPLMMVVLAVQGDLRVGLPGDAPDHALRIWLISERRQRGVGVSSTALAAPARGGVCVRTTVRYLLWEGQADNARYCECYNRTAVDAPWVPVDIDANACRQEEPSS